MPAMQTEKWNDVEKIPDGAGHIVGAQILISLWGSISERMYFHLKTKFGKIVLLIPLAAILEN